MIWQEKNASLLLAVLVFMTTQSILMASPIVINHLNWDPATLDKDVLDQVRQIYIMFGHQSVGLDIVEGLEALASNNPQRYSLTILNNPPQLTQPALTRWINGENFQPHGKIDAFFDKMRSTDGGGRIWGDLAYAAYFKFCYVDFNSLDINVDSLFHYYTATLEELETIFSNCLFVHVTVPITALIWASDKKRNANRHLYNDMLRAYVDSTDGILYDLADLEAFDENGNFQSFEYNGETYPMMWYDEQDPQNNGYSYDGGHLNDKGKLYMASAMWSLWGALIKALVPVELLTFRGNIIEDGIELVWTTASETTNYGFKIERSLDNRDFEEIGFIQGNGTSTVSNHYRFVDENPPSSGVVYYRLVQIDFDGGTKSYESIQVQLVQNLEKSFQLFQNYPNPFNNSTQIEFQVPASCIVNLVVYDVHGREIARPIQNRKIVGHHRLSFRADQMTSGIFFYKIVAGDFQAVRKMLVIK